VEPIGPWRPTLKVAPTGCCHPTPAKVGLLAPEISPSGVSPGDDARDEESAYLKLPMIWRSIELALLK
jgi:hypothetical protein